MNMRILIVFAAMVFKTGITGGTAVTWAYANVVSAYLFGFLPALAAALFQAQNLSKKNSGLGDCAPTDGRNQIDTARRQPFRDWVRHRAAETRTGPKKLTFGAALDTQADHGLSNYITKQESDY